MNKLQIRLWNGATTRDAWNPDSPEFIDDFKKEERLLHAASVRVTYGSRIQMEDVDEFPDEKPFQVEWDDEDNLIELDGVFYGDIEIRPAPAPHNTEAK